MADTVTVAFSNGSSLTGTKNHSVFVKDKGFIPLHSLHQGDIIVSQFSRSVLIAGKNTKPLSRPIVNSAMRTANKNIAQREKEVYFVSKKPCAQATVYDLNVDTIHEYFANGILVHNSERYVLSDFNPVDNMLGKPQSKRSSFRF